MISPEEVRAVAAKQAMDTAHPLDICACGHEREEHVGGHCAHLHKPRSCTVFRLCATNQEIMDGWEEWSRICEERGV